MQHDASFAAVLRAIDQQGDKPHALLAGDWCRFGDMLASDIDLRALTWNRNNIKKWIKEVCGIAAVWRQRFPEAAKMAIHRYGYPSDNYRTNLQYQYVYPSNWNQIPQNNPAPQQHHAPQQSQTSGHVAVDAAPDIPNKKKTAQSPVSPYGPTNAVAGCATDSEFDSESHSENESDSESKKSAQTPSENESDSESKKSAQTPSEDESNSESKKSAQAQTPSVDESNSESKKSAQACASRVCRRRSSSVQGHSVRRKRSSNPNRHSPPRSPVSSRQSERRERGRSRGRDDTTRHRERSEKSRSRGRPMRLDYLSHFSADTTDVWFIAGDDTLHGDFLTQVRNEASEAGWSVEAVCLPLNVVVHTGVAISQALFYVDLLSHWYCNTPRLHCVMSEASLKRWPQAEQSAWKSRLDNVNHCLRAFGVDGGSTRAMEEQRGWKHSHEHLLRSSLHTFMVLGDGPIGVINTSTYRDRLTWLGKRALSDQSLVEELVYANLYSPGEAKNGIKLHVSKGEEVKSMFEEITTRSGTGHNVLLIVMDPSGVPLMKMSS